MELTTAVLVTFLFLGILVCYREIRREGRATREDLTSTMKQTERLERKVDSFVHASTVARMMAEHAIARAERAEVTAARPVTLVMPPANENETKH